MTINTTDDQLQGETLEPQNAYGKPLFPDSVTMVACDQCDEAMPWPLRCRHTYVGIHSREYVRTAVAGPRGDVLLEIIKQVTKKHHESRTHPPTYCCPEDEPFYDRQLAKMLVEAIAAATSSPAPAESDANSLVKQWIDTLSDDSRVTDEDAEDLTLRIIAFAGAGFTPRDAPLESTRGSRGSGTPCS